MRQAVRLKSPQFPNDIYIDVLSDDLRTTRREKQSDRLSRDGWTEVEIRVMQATRDDDHSVALNT